MTAVSVIGHYEGQRSSRGDAQAVGCAGHSQPARILWRTLQATGSPLSLFPSLSVSPPAGPFFDLCPCSLPCLDLHANSRRLMTAHHLKVAQPQDVDVLLRRKGKALGTRTQVHEVGTLPAGEVVSGRRRFALQEVRPARYTACACRISQRRSRVRRERPEGSAEGREVLRGTEDLRPERCGYPFHPLLSCSERPDPLVCRSERDIFVGGNPWRCYCCYCMCACWGGGRQGFNSIQAGSPRQFFCPHHGDEGHGYPPSGEACAHPVVQYAFTG